MSKKKSEAKKLVAHKEPETITTTAETATTEIQAEAVASTEKAIAADKTEKKGKAPKEPKPKKEKKEKPVRDTLAHMAKVDKYASTLPPLSEDAQAVFAQAETLSSGELNVLSAHISLRARKLATASAAAVTLKEGDRVRIHSGTDTRFIGKEGIVTRCQRIRIFVKVLGFGKDAYLFASNVDRVQADKIDVSDDAPESAESKTATG